MNPIRLLLSAIFSFFPVVLWNIIALDYINTNGKLIPWLIAGPVAYIATGIFQGFRGSLKPVYVKQQFNPFWGWFVVALAIQVFIAALSNT